MPPMKHRLLAAFVCGFCVWALPAKADDSRTRSSRPNVVVFLADDAGWGDYSRRSESTRLNSSHQ